MAYDNRDRLIALAALYQAVSCVARIAHQGMADTEAMEPCVYSLFQVDADTVEAVFGGAGAVTAGARQLVHQLTGQTDRNMELTRYAVLVIKLERALSRRPDLIAAVGRGIEDGKAKCEHFGMLHPNLFAHFAEVYSSTLSQLSPRIMVRGDPSHLGNPDNQARVRTLLLAAVRAARLWRQVGGSRLQILFKNRQILEDARDYINAHAH